MSAISLRQPKIGRLSHLMNMPMDILMEVQYDIPLFSLKDLAHISVKPRYSAIFTLSTSFMWRAPPRLFDVS
jgi:hypothetical protein